MNDMRRLMTLVESVTTKDPEIELAELRAEVAPLMQKWFEVIKATPEPTDPVEKDAWKRDTNRGGLWFEIILPMQRRIRELEQDAAALKRAETEAVRAANDGFEHNEVLYHGSNAEFLQFDMSKARTAQHIYTSPDRDTAEKYGDYVYTCYGRQHPQADLSAESEDWGLMRRVFDHGGGEEGWDMSFGEFEELVTNGQLYQSHASSSLQDEVVDICLDMGYRSVRLSDMKPGGGFSDSVIFGDPANLKIIEAPEHTP